MQVTILTHWPGVCKEVLEQQFDSFNPVLLMESSFTFELVWRTSDDSEYRDWQAWGSDALACGLVWSFGIQRSGE